MFSSVSVLDFFSLFLIFFGFFVFLVHPTVVLVLLSASVERFYVSLMRDFFVQRGLLFCTVSVFSCLFPLLLILLPANDITVILSWKFQEAIGRPLRGIYQMCLQVFISGFLSSKNSKNI